MSNTKHGAVIPKGKDFTETIVTLIKNGFSSDCFDAVLIPTKDPISGQYTHTMIDDTSLLNNVYPLCPVMTIQGARIISATTKFGRGKKKIAAFLRPCEIRATVELYKLGQVNLEHIILISTDCPGAYPLADWIDNPDQIERSFTQLTMEDNRDLVRPVCQMCDKFASTGGEDLHIGTTGLNGQISLIPNGTKGTVFLEKLGIPADKDISDYLHKVDLITTKRGTRRQKTQQKLKASVKGLDNLTNFFAKCIDCHNCMRVCPICYCRQCFFDSYDAKFPFEDYLTRAKAAGGLRLLPDTLLFHIGRMLHMSLSCVSCGACEDACPVSIPIAQLFSLVGSRNQEAFEYTPGHSLGISPPLRVYKEDEFEELEQSYTGSTARLEVSGV